MVNLHCIDFLKWNQETRHDTVWLPYFVHVPLVPPYCCKRPHGWGPMGRFGENF